MKSAKNAFYKKGVPKLIFFNEFFFQKYSDDFWHRKFTLKVQNWHFLTNCHWMETQNLVISFNYSWFLAKNFSNFVSLAWKLHNRYCHYINAVDRIICVDGKTYKLLSLYLLLLTLTESRNNKQKSDQIRNVD